MIDHLSKGDIINIIIIENTGISFTFQSHVIEQGTAINRTLTITAPRYEGVSLDLSVLAGKQLLLVFETVLKNDPVYIAYAAYYDYTIAARFDDEEPTYSISLQGSPKVMRKRNSKRIDAELELSFKLLDGEQAPSFRGKTVNISTGGLKFKTHKRIKNDVIPIILSINGTELVLDGHIRGIESSRDDSAEFLYRVTFIQDKSYRRSKLDQHLAKLRLK